MPSSYQKRGKMKSANLQLTESLEDYLEAIAELIEVEGHAHAKEIAAKLNVKMPSVTGALRPGRTPTIWKKKSTSLKSS